MIQWELSVSGDCLRLIDPDGSAIASLMMTAPTRKFISHLQDGDTITIRKGALSDEC